MARQVRHIGVRLEGERDEAVRHVSFRLGSSLRDILNSSSSRVRSACSGLGGCGLCRVRIDEGTVEAPTTAELLHLGEDALEAGTRLACQVIPSGDMDVTVLEPARPSSWRAPSSRPYVPAYPPAPDRAARGSPLGIAVDLGTSQITVAMCDLAKGRRLALRSGPNPQVRLGADVIGRLDAAARRDLTARRLQRWVVEAIGSALLHLSRDEGIALDGARSVRVVGNSAMLTLLSGHSSEALLDPAGWEAPIDCTPGDASELARAWNLDPMTAIQVVQPLGGFVGSDLLAGAVHCRFGYSRQPALLVDFGTNSEIGLWDGTRLWATSAAGGPAFEATGIGCGMGAEPGAIQRLWRSLDGVWGGEVFESAAPRGICGSGLVDLLAILRSGGEVDERGRILHEPATLRIEGAEFSVSKADVDTLQRAKAAVAAGILVLLRRAGLRFDQLGAVYVAGSFGEHLDIDSAARIGLLPSIPGARVHLVGNTALEGALDLLISDEAEMALTQARRSACLINLSMEEAFEELFVDHLYIRPFGVRG